MCREKFNVSGSLSDYRSICAEVKKKWKKASSLFSTIASGKRSNCHYQFDKLRFSPSVSVKYAYKSADLRVLE